VSYIRLDERDWWLDKICLYNQVLLGGQYLGPIEEPEDT